MDPLVMLHEYAVGKVQRREVTNDTGSYVIFGDVAYSKDAKTSLTCFGKSNQYYTLESLLLFWDNRNLAHPAYVKDAAGKQVQAVTRADRREILEYLRGDRAELPSMYDKFAPISATIPMSHFQDMEGPERKKMKLDPNAKAPRINHLLNEGTGLATTTDTSELRALNNDLTADKIAALKAKRRKHQSKNILQTEDDLAVGEAGQLERRDLRDRERIWRTRENCLESTFSRNFTNILNICQVIKNREEAAARLKAAGAGHGPPISSSAPRSATEMARQAAAARSSRPVGYSRYDQEQFNTGDVNEFGVDAAEQTFVGQPLNMLNRPTSQSISTKPQPQHSAQRLPNTITSHGQHQTPSISHHSRSTVLTPSDPNRLQKRSSRTPIIVIPTAASSLITMYNVKEMLQDMRYVTTDEKRASGARRESECLLHRKRGDVTVPYRVIENPLKLTQEEWDRVVAVFAMGPAWQFKGWRWEGNPVDIFANLAAFHVTYDDSKLDANIAKWSVTVIPVSRTKRHLDKARLVKFWEVLDKHIMKNKPFLRY